jgi:hypothetical protein
LIYLNAHCSFFPLKKDVDIAPRAIWPLCQVMALTTSNSSSVPKIGDLKQVKYRREDFEKTFVLLY